MSACICCKKCLEAKVQKSDLLNSEGCDKSNPLLLFNNLIWRIDEVASYLKCSKGHIYNLVHKDEIPFLKKGKFLFFIPEQIREWILEGN
jgi:excisionase family DNA binding protein